MTSGISNMNPKSNKVALGIGIASAGRLVPAEWAIAMATQAWPVNSSLAWMHIIAKTIDEAREEAVEQALKYNCKYLWFVDDDTVPPIDAARKLMYVLDQEDAKGSNIKVCGGIYCIKQDPPQPLVFMGPGEGAYWKWKIGDVFPCWGLGTGCMMIRTDVFREIPKPWFVTTSDINMQQTDDLYFCDKLKAAGLGVMAHGGVLCSHWDVVNGLIYTLPKDSYPMQIDGSINVAI